MICVDTGSPFFPEGGRGLRLKELNNIFRMW